MIGTDLRLISKKVAPSSPPTLAFVTYSIAIRNNGPLSPDALYNANKALFIPNTVVITDALPTGLTFVSASAGGVAVGNTVVWKIPGWGDGPATTGDFTRTVTVTAQVKALAGTLITNRVEGIQGAFTASGAPIMNDPLPANNAPAGITAVFRVNSPASAKVELRSSSTSITEGTRITATLVYTDLDPLDTHNVKLVWGDGAPAVVLTNVTRPDPFVNPSNVLTFTHVYADDRPTGPDTFTITANVTDSNGLASAPASTIVTVNNVLPITSTPTISVTLKPQPGKYVQTLSKPLTITLPFSDPGFKAAFAGSSPETIRYRVDWGDNTSIPTTTVPGVTNGGVDRPDDQPDEGTGQGLALVCHHRPINHQHLPVRRRRQQRRARADRARHRDAAADWRQRLPDCAGRLGDWVQRARQ